MSAGVNPSRALTEASTIYEDPAANLPSHIGEQLNIATTQPDKILHVRWGQQSTLTFSLLQDSGFEGDWETQAVTTKDDIQESLSDIAALIGDVASKKYRFEEDVQAIKENMAGIGANLFERLLPQELQDRAVSWPDQTVLCVSTNEQWIPWEFSTMGKGIGGNASGSSERHDSTGLHPWHHSLMREHLNTPHGKKRR